MTAPLHTAAETAAIREKVINHYALLIVKRVFAKYPQIKSAYFAVAQYWDDNASDQVHNFILYSVLNIPDWDAYARTEREKEEYWINDPINLPGFPEDQYELDEEVWGDEGWEKLENDSYFYDLNGLTHEIVAAFAAFCQEGCHQNMYSGESYTPYALFTRTDTGIKTEIVGKMLRPWLDGIRPEADY